MKSANRQRAAARSRWLAIAGLGLVASLLPLTGIIAGTTDTAQTGTNSVASRAEPASADIVVARAGFGEVDTAAGPMWMFTCGTFSENLTSPFFAVTDLTRGTSSGPNVDADHYELCVENVGAAPVEVRVFADERVDIDVSCTGDEADHDATCGGASGGDLGDALLFLVGADPTCEGEPSQEPNSLTTLESTGYLLGSIGPGGRVCARFSVAYPDVSNAILQRAQSDEVTWRYVVAATATGA